MIVPGQIQGLDLNSGGAGQSPMVNAQPSSAMDNNLLMAAATMQKLGRLGGRSDAMTPKAPTSKRRQLKVI